MFLFLKKVYEKTVHVLETINVNKWMKLSLKLSLKSSKKLSLKLSKKISMKFVPAVKVQWGVFGSPSTVVS